MTYGSSQGEHIFEEGITEDGVLTWQSQPKQKLSTPMIQEFIEHNEVYNNIYLFLRPSKKISTYTYLGTLAYLEHDVEREEPVYFKWKILDWELTSERAASTGIELIGDSNITTFSRVGTTTFLEEYDKTPYLEETLAPSERINIRVGIGTEQFRSSNIDFEDSNRRNSRFGEAGENAVIEMEKRTLIAAGKSVYAEQVVSTRKKLGNNAPYDVLSFTPNGKEKYIEVKTTKGGQSAPFYISAREVLFSGKNEEQYYLYCVYDFDPKTNKGKFYKKKGNIEDYCKLEPISYKATLK